MGGGRCQGLGGGIIWRLRLVVEKKLKEKYVPPLLATHKARLATNVSSDAELQLTMEWKSFLPPPCEDNLVLSAPFQTSCASTPQQEKASSTGSLLMVQQPAYAGLGAVFVRAGGWLTRCSLMGRCARLRMREMRRLSL